MVFNYTVSFYDDNSGDMITSTGYCFGEGYEMASEELVKYFGENIESFSLKWMAEDNILCADLSQSRDKQLMEEAYNKFRMDTL